MIFTSESGLTDPGRIRQWDEWYLGHLAAMVAGPGISSAQRFRALDAGPPPSLAIYSVASPAVFDSDIYLRTRGMGPFVAGRRTLAPAQPVRWARRRARRADEVHPDGRRS